MTQVVVNGKLIEVPSGEVIENQEEVLDVMVPLREEKLATFFSGSGNLPIHLQKAKELGISPKVLSSYIGVVPESPEHHFGQVVHIIGAIGYFSGPFTPKDPTRDGSGYYKSVIKLSETREHKIMNGETVIKHRRNITIATGGSRFAGMIAPLLEMYGWFDWPEGFELPAIITQGPNGEHLLEVIDA